MGVPIVVTGFEANNLLTLPPADLVIDSLIGYSLVGHAQGTVAALIEAANSHGAPILALDVPSGLNITTGAVSDCTVPADATMTLALPKVGLRAEAAKPFIGELYLADISVPTELYAKPPLSLEVENVFAKNEIVRLW